MDQVSKTKTRYRRGEWVEIIKRRQESGQTLQNFCRENGLSPKTYYYWLRKLREAVCNVAGENQAIVPIVAAHTDGPMSSGERILIRTSELTVELTGTSPETIQAAILALRQLC